MQRGVNYRKYQIKTPDNDRVKYYSPDDVQLVMVNAKLVNHKGTARRIYEGANKTVCAWVECDDLKVIPKGEVNINQMQKITYNPRTSPYWMMNEMTVDGRSFNVLYTYGNRIYCPMDNIMGAEQNENCSECGDVSIEIVCGDCSKGFCNMCMKEAHLIDCNYCEGSGEYPTSWDIDSGDRWNPPTLDINSWGECDYCEEGKVCESKDVPEFYFERPERDEDDYYAEESRQDYILDEVAKNYGFISNKMILATVAVIAGVAKLAEVFVNTLVSAQQLDYKELKKDTSNIYQDWRD